MPYIIFSIYSCQTVVINFSCENVREIKTDHNGPPVRKELILKLCFDSFPIQLETLCLSHFLFYLLKGMRAALSILLVKIGTFKLPHIVGFLLRKISGGADRRLRNYFLYYRTVLIQYIICLVLYDVR